jgi:fructokinase
VNAAPGRLLVIGEALIDVIERADGVERRVGGSPLNVAIGAARLGLASTLHTRFGTDADGDLIAAQLAESHVRVTSASRDARPTDLAIARIRTDGSADYRFELHGPVAALGPEDAAEAPTVVHIGSIGAVPTSGADEIDAVLAAARATATLSYDPNARPLLMTADGVRERIARLALGSDIVKVSDEDLAWLDPDRDPLDLAASWHAAGVPLVIVTRGADGAVAFADAGEVAVPGVPATVADTVGAGDSFMAATLAALAPVGVVGGANVEALRRLDRDDLEAVLRFAATCAAITVSRVGADPPRLSEVTFRSPERFARG